jgi:hypothetical protein
MPRSDSLSTLANSRFPCSTVSQFPIRTPIRRTPFTRRMLAARSGLSKPESAELQREVDIDEAISHLRDLVPGYLTRREDLMALASAISAKRELKVPAEAQAARSLQPHQDERLG